MLDYSNAVDHLHSSNVAQVPEKVGSFSDESCILRLSEHRDDGRLLPLAGPAARTRGGVSELQ
jgi:hypothetical protein